MFSVTPEVSFLFPLKTKILFLFFVISLSPLWKLCLHFIRGLLFLVRNELLIPFRDGVGSYSRCIRILLKVEQVRINQLMSIQDRPIKGSSLVFRKNRRGKSGDHLPQKGGLELEVNVLGRIESPRLFYKETSTGETLVSPTLVGRE